MKVIIQSIRAGAAEVGQIDIAQIAQYQYATFATELNKIAGAILVPSTHPAENDKENFFPDTINHRMYFTAEQEQQMQQLLKQYAIEKSTFLKTFFLYPTTTHLDDEFLALGA